ncbi:MAG: choice-of-anchor A family protein [Ignavibacteriaceae bacterium]|nr:choice-of-anchor A family protein [Ignavibacteriaceae bacterium]
MNKKYFTIGLALLVVSMISFIRADVNSIAEVTGKDKGVGIHLPWPVNDDYFAGTFKAVVDGNATSLYCIDLYHHLAYNEDYQDVEATNDTLAYILNNYYPYKTNYTNMLSDIKREAAAIQLTLWNITDGLNLSTLSGQDGAYIGDILTRVAEIKADAFANTHSFNLNTFVINIPAQSFTNGSPVTFTVQAFNENGLAMANVQISLSTTSGTLSTTSITTGANGVSPNVTLTPASGQTTATITATGVVGIPSGTKYYHVANPNGKQKLILATPTIASRTIYRTVNWSNSFNLVVSKTADKSVVNNGDIINYTIKVKNTGTGNAQNVKVSDQLASVLDFISSVPSGVYNTTTGIWNAGTVNANDSVSLSIKVKVNYGNTSASTYDLGAATGFNLFVLDTLIQPSSDTEGKVAVGGYADLRNYSVGDKLPLNSGNVLVVGNHLTFISGRVYNGKALYGNFITSTTGFSADDGIEHNSVIDFNAAKIHLTNLSNQLSTLTQTDTVKFEWGHVELVGHNNSENVFYVDGAMLSAANNFSVTVPNNSTAIVNVRGNYVDWMGGCSIVGTTKEKVLLNFFEADTVKIHGINVTASILAPKSVLDFPTGLVTGQVMVRCMFGAGQFNNSMFEGSITNNITVANFATIVSATQSSMPSIIDVPASMAMVSNKANGATGVENDNVVPNEFNLLQNYPNPFNPATTISFSLVNSGLVNLSVFNITGEKVATLVNKEYQTGNYTVEFNANNLPSGIYLYRLSAGNFVSTKKMILMK